ESTAMAGFAATGRRPATVGFWQILGTSPRMTEPRIVRHPGQSRLYRGNTRAACLDDRAAMLAGAGPGSIPERLSLDIKVTEWVPDSSAHAPASGKTRGGRAGSLSGHALGGGQDC